ncbi:formimidoylglutamate deiminase [Thalassotalea sp. PLHSN55]|uniref:formimidoylglutamate deiminase n=1 Tax=Thalassotalea sp. PLHSN55 TaxID=3435888 RepID=UPI003F870FDF
MKLFAEKILLSTGWHSNQTLTIEDGVITDIASGSVAGAEVAQGPVIPGMVNCHSHAFQRAFAGFSEQGSEGQDSFWTWRNIMYKFLDQLSEQDVQVIAEQLYIEMLTAGYTRVAEFHYLHHNVQGECKNDAAMAKAIFSAAQNSGIGLTLLPVFYQFSGFGAKPPTDGQKRFIHATEDFNQLVEQCFTLSKTYPNTNVGIAPHSLRAVDEQGLHAVVNFVRQLDRKAPIHIHIAEQQQEVNDCLAHYGQRPVQWLHNHVELDKHWCLIHATHINEQERQAIAKTQAVAGICPTTEANLGDGIFPTTEFLQDQGVIAIGSDSHISVNPIEELRWLEYSQRLIRQQRAVLANNEQASVGLNLWTKAALGGAQSTSANVGELAVGKQADLLVLDNTKTALFAKEDKFVIDSLVFASQSNHVQDVMVNGQWQVINQQHPLAKQSAQKFSQLIARLSA